MTALLIFCIAYLGIALGRVPGLMIDRIGIALLGAIAMITFGIVSPKSAVSAIDWSTILLLYALMIVSAQLRLGGFYTWLTDKIITQLSRPKSFLLVLMTLSAGLSALLANDIICFAFTPVLAAGLLQARLNPLPFLIGLAVSSNIGSAATIIGNPQNMLIGQMGHLDFGPFILWCAPPALVSLIAGYVIIIKIYKNRLWLEDKTTFSESPSAAHQMFDPWQTGKGILAIVALVVLFFTPIPREITGIGVAGILLCSRKMRTRDILGLVDWHLITLFLALFVIIHGISQEGMLDRIGQTLRFSGIDVHHLPTLTGLSVLLSNIVSNVPAAILMVGFLDPQHPNQWYTLAVSSTFAGNLFLLGSIANLIVVEQAAYFGIKISFKEHAVVGIPVTLTSLLILLGWMAIMP